MVAFELFAACVVIVTKADALFGAIKA